MSVKNAKSFLAVLLILFLSCKKGSENTTPPGDTLKLLIDDGPASAVLGKRISLTGAVGFTWGKNSTELITEAGLKMYQLDLTNKQYHEIVSTPMLITGKNHDNSALIMAGTINGKLGYFEYDFDTRQTAQILSFGESDGTILNKSGNNLFFFTQQVTPPTSCDDYCWGGYVGANSNANFFYLDFTTKHAVPLKDKIFSCFSKDGAKSLLQTRSRDSFFIFDNSAKKLVDSFSFDIINAGLIDVNNVKTFYDSEPKFISLATNNEITVRSLRTLAQIDKLPTVCFPGDLTGFKWSDDGTKIYYTTVKGASCDRIYLSIYDLETNQESIIIDDASHQSGGSNPVEYIELASDNKRILVKYQNDFYFRDLN